MLFREILNTGRLNWCELMKNWKDNLILAELLTFIDASAPGNLHQCPYSVNHLVIGK